MLNQNNKETQAENFSVLKKKRKLTVMEKIKKYNLEMRYNYTPTGFLTRNLHLLLSPFLVAIGVFIILCFVVSVLVIVNPQLSHLTGLQKGNVAVSTLTILFPINMILSYMINFIIIHPIAKFNHYQTSHSNYLPVCFLVIFTISMCFWLFLYYLSSNNFNANSDFSNLFLPLWINVLGICNMFFYRVFNELYKRET